MAYSKEERVLCGAVLQQFEVEASARAGCRLCTLLLQALTDHKLLKPLRQIEARLSFIGRNAASCLFLQRGFEGKETLSMTFAAEKPTPKYLDIDGVVALGLRSLPASARL